MAGKGESTPPFSWRERHFGNWTQILAVLISLFGFSFVVMQLRATRLKSIEDSHRAELIDARKLYLAYSDAALRYAHLTEPDYDALLRDRTEYLRYKQFVSQMLYAFDEILNAVGNYQDSGENKEEWVATFETDIEPHQRYICQASDERFLATYRPDMRRRLVEANNAHCKNMQPLEQPTATTKP